MNPYHPYSGASSHHHHQQQPSQDDPNAAAAAAAAATMPLDPRLRQALFDQQRQQQQQQSLFLQLAQGYPAHAQTHAPMAGMSAAHMQQQQQQQQQAMYAMHPQHQYAAVAPPSRPTSTLPYASPPPQQQQYHPHARYATPAPASASSSQQQQSAGTFAVLTSSGHTLAAADTYADALSAARNVKRSVDGTLAEEGRACPYCGKVCDRPSTLRTHLNSHTGERPYTCYVPGCGRQFTVLSNMYRHAKTCAVAAQQAAQHQQ